MNIGNTFQNHFSDYCYENKTEDVGSKFIEAKEKFGAFVEERIKNGEPKIQIGASEMSEKEWDKLVEKIDKDIHNIKEEMEQRNQKKRIKDGELVTKKGEDYRGQSLMNHIQNKDKVPYSYLAEDGIVNYNGVTFVCNEEQNALCLGDMSDTKNVITIPMSNGGSIKVNRDNISDLSRAIGMFSAEDRKRIMEALAMDAKVQQSLQELEDEKNSIGEESSKNDTSL